MKAGQRPARDRDEEEREQRAGEDRACATAGERGDGRSLHDGTGQQNAERKQGDGADLHEGRQVVARGEQKPHGQHRRGEAVDDDAPRQGHLRQGEPVGAPSCFGNPATRDHGEQQQNYTDQRDFGHPTGAQEPQIQTHENRDRDGHRNREDAPRALGERTDHDKGQHRQQDHHDDEDADDGGYAADRAELVARHLSQRATAPSGGDRQHQIVLNTAGHNRADDDPNGSRQKPHLHGQHRADQRTGTGDGGEVVSEQHPPVGRHVIRGIFEKLCGGGIVVTRSDDLHLDQPSVEPEPDDVGADRGDDEPHRVDRLSAEEGDDRPRDRTDDRDDSEDDLVSGRDRRSVDDGDRRKILVGSDVSDIAVSLFETIGRWRAG